MNAMERFCPEPEVLARYLDGGLPAEERSRVTGHLADCDDCRRTIALSSTLGAAPEARVNEVLLHRVVVGSRRRRVLPIAAAAAVLLAGVAGVLFVRSSGGEAPAPRILAEPSPPAPVALSKPPPAAAPAVRTDPAPPPEVAKAPVPEPSRPLPPVVAKEAPRPAPEPAAPKPLPAPVPSSPPAPESKPDPVAVQAPDPAKTLAEDKGFAPVLVVDPVGDLWLKRDQEESKAGAFERAAWKDRLSTRGGAASFSLEARASVMLEKGSDAAITRVKTDDSYSLALGQGLVMLDTEGSSQKWRISFGPSELDFSNFNGRLSVESRGDRVSAMLLDGAAELKIGSLAKKATVGQEVVLTREGQVVEQKGEALKKLARLDELRPKLFMAFAATFDEKKEDLPLFPYTITTGRLAPGPTGLYLQCEGPPSARTGERMTLAGEVRPDRAFSVASGMVLKFRYRTTLPSFTVKLGKYSAELPSRRIGQWAEMEVPLREFTFEGTPLLPTDPVDLIRFSVTFDKRSGQLDIDGIQFQRRVR